MLRLRTWADAHDVLGEPPCLHVRQNDLNSESNKDQRILYSHCGSGASSFTFILIVSHNSDIISDPMSRNGKVQDMTVVECTAFHHGTSS